MLHIEYQIFNRLQSLLSSMTIQVSHLEILLLDSQEVNMNVIGMVNLKLKKVVNINLELHLIKDQKSLSTMYQLLIDGPLVGMEVN